MKDFRRLLIAVPVAVLVACLVGIYLTRGAMAHLSFLKSKGGSGAGAASGLVDQRPWQTVQALAPLAVSAEEQMFAREAQRLGDHEVDQAFAVGLGQGSTGARGRNGGAEEVPEKSSSCRGIG